MSDIKSLVQEESFTSKLDIVMVSTKRLRRVIDIAAHNPSAVICIVGKSGIGKSAIPMQAATDRKAPLVAFYVPMRSVEDFSIPTMATDTKKYYDTRIQRIFEPIFDFCERNKGKILPGKGPIIVFEEINRAKDKSVTNACFTILSTRRIGDLPLPDEVQIICTMNPAGKGYGVNEFERDGAFRRRLTFVGVTASFGEFIQYARGAKYHKAVIDHLEAQPQWFYSDTAAAAGKVFPCPASWETVSGLCYALDAQDVALTGPEAKALFAGKIGLHATEAFHDFIGNNSVVITAKEVIKGYTEGSNTRARLLQHIEQGNHPALIALISNVAHTLMDGSERKPATFSAQLSLFMADLPAETMQAFIQDLNTAANDIDGGAKYRSKLTLHMASDPQFKVAMQRLLATRETVDKANGG